MKLLMGLILLMSLATACSTGHCRRDGSMVPDKVDAKPPTGFEQENLGSIYISKPDGSLQCEVKSGLSLSEMARRQLKGVKIISSLKKHDGLVRIQSCGASTGMLNVYEIKHRDLSRAHKSGFIVIKEKY